MKNIKDTDAHRSEGGLELKLEQIPSVSSLDWNYIFKDQKIYHSSRHTHQAINLFEDRMTGWCGGKSFIAESDLPLFAREMLPELEKISYRERTFLSGKLSAGGCQFPPVSGSATTGYHHL